MINWDAPCKTINCEHLYYVYGCEPECALKKSCDRIDDYLATHDAMYRTEHCGGCKGYESNDLCHICSRNYRDMYRG